MRTAKLLNFTGVAAICFAGYLWTNLSAQQDPQIKIKPTDIGGVVASSKGPEAGVWVIAETTSLPTRYIKEVVTDDRGRYLIPDLPKAKYTVWARGYGLVDSPKTETEPGKVVNLKPSIAPDAKTAAQLYPAEYWYALLKVPEKNEFPGTGPPETASRPTSRTRASGSISSRPTAANPAISSAINTPGPSPRCSRSSIHRPKPGRAAWNPGKPATP